MKAKKNGLHWLVKMFLVGAVLGVAGWAVLHPFADRSRRAHSFASYIKEGFTIQQVFAGPREWDFLWVDCNPAGKPADSIRITKQEENYLARPIEGERRQYPNLDALVADLSSGTGLFVGRSAINLAYQYYMVSGTFVLTLGPDGRVTNVKRISRG